MKQDSGNREVVNPLEVFIDLLATAVAKKIREPADAAWITQAESPLGRIRHCAAVRRRVTKGDAGACIVGRDFKLTPEALQEELAAVSKKRVPVKAEPSSIAADLERQLRKVGAR